ncbi:MAG: hypothetical protein ABR928_19870 [Terracidiphilus sp.]|jgi:hypothetical protein
MPNITATVDQTVYSDARVFAARMAAFQTAQSTQNREKSLFSCETVKAG